MTGETLQIGGRTCALYGAERPRALLLQPTALRDMQAAERLALLIGRDREPDFVLCAFPIGDWNRELSPWPAPAIYGDEPFRGGASETLAFAEEALLPGLRARYGAVSAVIGGYSLAGLFALWCGYETDLFAAVAAASPSVWFDGWTEYAAGRRMQAGAVYLSLGDREERAARQRLARVGDCVREQKRALDAAGVPAALVWERGNHFRDVPERTGRGFAWALDHIPQG